jgi:hypothetical protein
MTPAMANAMVARIRARQRLGAPRLHPAVAGAHVISITRDVAGSDVFSVATCSCSWRSRVEISELADQDIAIEGHWRDVIAAADGVAA